jgi:hypothetical protein
LLGSAAFAESLMAAHAITLRIFAICFVFIAVDDSVRPMDGKRILRMMMDDVALMIF